MIIRTHRSGSVLLSAYVDLPPPPKDLPVITRLRGSPDAEVLLLAEHPTEEEYANNVPWCDQAAITYCQIMEQQDINTDKFLVMPFSRFGAKPNKASTEWCLPLLKEHLPHSPVKCVVVIGMHAFGFTFAGGRKTHAKTIIGNPMYLPYIGTLPVFVMPDSSLLLEQNSDDFRMAQAARKKAEIVFGVAGKLRNFLTNRLQIKL